jgi:hypothetical protein
MEGVNLIKIYHKHKCKCHNEYSLYNYMLMKKKSISYGKVKQVLSEGGY